MIDRFAQLALDCVHREYPNHIVHLLTSDSDAQAPRNLTPAFYGCFDWHSAVHGHWLLAQAVQRAAAPAVRQRAFEALEKSLVPTAIAGELAYRLRNRAFERPYGIAWLCALDAALRGSDSMHHLALTLEPLVSQAVADLLSWLSKLTRPARTGLHNQTAFSLGLVLDWASAGYHRSERELLEARARQFFETDHDYAVHLEPDGEDFLSPALGAADLMTRVLSPADFATWLDRTIACLGRDHSAWLTPAVVSDPSDGRLAHLDGLNLSRAWMLRRIAAHLPSTDGRIPSILTSAKLHGDRGLASVSDEHYAGSHWLGTFATYWLTSS